MLYYKDLENKVLHSDMAANSNKLFVISGYVGAELIKTLSSFPSSTQFEIIYGMYGCDNISEPLHKKLVELHNSLPNVNISYSLVPIHSKIYCWFCNDKVKGGLIGSANFTINGLRKDFKETLCDIKLDSIDEYRKYFKYVCEHSIPCTDTRVILRKYKHITTKADTKEQPYLSDGICRISLLDKFDKIPLKSGLNWGCSRGHVSKGDAYIRITTKYIKQFPDLFPQKKYVNGIINEESKGKANRENDEIELIWDDGTSMIGLLEGQNVVDGVIYPKQLSTSPQKNILGKYLRKRLGNLPLEYIIHKKDLLKYGRTSIDISKIGDGIYYLDFSVNKKKNK